MNQDQNSNLKEDEEKYGEENFIRERCLRFFVNSKQCVSNKLFIKKSLIQKIRL